MFKNTDASLGLAILRIGTSLSMLRHGLPKLELLFSESLEFPDPLGVGPMFSLILTLIGEVIAPILILIGYKTRIAAIPSLITMLVAAFVIHGQDPFDKKELALIYALCFLVIAIGGPGKFAIDKK